MRSAPQTLIGNRDGLRQTVFDLMQLVRMVQGGVDVDGDGTLTSARRGSTTPASRSAGSTACSCSASSRRFARVSRTSRADRSSRSRGFRRTSGPSWASRSSRGCRRSTTCCPERRLHELQREHPATEPADPRRHGSRRLGDPAGDRLDRVGSAVGEPGRVRAARDESDHPPVRTR